MEVPQSKGKSPPPRPPQTPRIHISHPNVPDDVEKLIVDHDSHSNSSSKTGIDNPVFVFDDVSRPASRASLTSLTAPTRTLPPVRRGSYSPFLPSLDKDSLAVPDSLSLNRRRSSETSSWSRDSGASRRLLKPLQVSSLDNLSVTGEGDPRHHHPLPSPGLLSINSLWSTSDLQRSPRRQRHVDPDALSSLTNTNSLSNVSSTLSDRMHELVRAFSSRTQRTKERTAQPPTPSSDSDCDDAKSAVSGFDDQPPPQRNIRLGSFIPMESRASEAFSEAAKDTFVGVWHCRFKLPKCLRKLRFPDTIEPQSKLYIFWLFLVCITFMYNCWTIPLRGLFPYQTPSNVAYWMLCDYLGDLIYVLDIAVFKPRIRFINEGTYETDRSLTKKHYMKKWMFKFDVLSLIPLDLFYLLVGVVPWLRLPRTLKVQTFWEFYERCDQAARTMVHVIRIIKTMTYMLFLIHIETCGYYAVSLYEGINSNRWVYNGTGNAYIRCFYLATKTATSIGNNPKPTNQLEYMFMTLYWLSGVFVFALLIGQIRDIVQAAGHVKEMYQKRVDATLWYMNSMNIPKPLQDRVRDWFNYNWEQQKTLDEKSLLETLPRKLQTDLAINVHFNTLSKVQLFQDCDKLLLYDLVLKLRPVVYLPGDYICRKGEVGKEMYIVSLGQVEVVGGRTGETVLATLHEGSVFGEISLLAMSGLGGNRRTANVRCTGYTNLFILSKFDFEEAMREYPEAQKLLKKRAKKLLKENARREKKTTKIEPENIIKTPPGTPKLLRAVIQVMNPESEVVKQLGSSLHLQGKGEGEQPSQVTAKIPEEGQTNSHQNHAYQHGSEISLPNLVPPNPLEDDDSGGECDNDEDDDLDEELLIVEKMDAEQSLLPEPRVRDPHIRAPTPTPLPPA